MRAHNSIITISNIWKVTWYVVDLSNVQMQNVKILNTNRLTLIKNTREVLHAKRF